MSNLINNKYGYVENIKNEHEYKNIDYRDTIVPLWDTLFNQYYNNEYVSNNDIKQINLALCASIIQLGKLIKTESRYNQIHEINIKLEFIEKKQNNDLSNTYESLNLDSSFLNNYKKVIEEFSLIQKKWKNI